MAFSAICDYICCYKYVNRLHFSKGKPPKKDAHVGKPPKREMVCNLFITL